jgi:pimeloyl-ACP methyl ester carboxylesterase
MHNIIIFIVYVDAYCLLYCTRLLRTGSITNKSFNVSHHQHIALTSLVHFARILFLFCSVSTMVLRTGAVVVLLFSALLLAPPFDKDIIVGDFNQTEYGGKLNPLSDPRIVVEDIFFPSHGETCHGWLYSPPPPEASADEHGESIGKTNPPTVLSRPTIIMTPGIASQTDMGLDRYAEKFVEAGYAVFLFNFRNFGASTGTPRNWVSPKRHIEDLMTALDYIESRPASLMEKMDPTKILLWGTSFSGGHVLEVAARRMKDPNILGVVAQVPHLSGYATAKVGLKKRGLAKVARMAWGSLQDKARQFAGLPPLSVKIITPSNELALMPVTPEDHARYEAKQSKEQLGGWKNQSPLRVLLELRSYSPIETLRQLSQEDGNGLKIPILFIGASDDDLTPPDLIEEASKLVKNSKFVLKEGSHFEIYEPRNYVPLANEMVAFYDQCVA